MRWYISTYITKEEEKKKTTVNSQRSGTYQKPSVSVSRNTDFSERKKRGKTREKKNRKQRTTVNSQCRETPTFQQGAKVSAENREKKNRRPCTGLSKG